MDLHRLLISAAVLFVPAVASADVLLTANRPFDVKERYSSSVPEWEDRMGYSLLFSAPPGTLGDPSLPWLFQNLMLTPGDVGKTFTATAASDPNFAANVASMTNGVNDSFYVRTLSFAPTRTSGSWRGANEQQELFGSDGRPGPDLAGYEIQSVSITFDSFSIGDYSETIQNELVQGQRFTGDVTLTIEGVAVPEPTSLLLLPASVVLLRRRRT